MNATKTWEEVDRLSALERMSLMDTPAEPEFDELVAIAAAICETPMSLVTLLDDRRQWFKAMIGMNVQETPREVAFCSTAILQQDILLVEDAAEDPRFKDNPLVTGEPNLRFYAGMPIASPDGFPLGTLCVLDRVPRKLSKTQLAALKVLGRQVNARMELRLHRQAMERALAEAKEVRTKLEASERRFVTFMDSAPFMSYLKRADGSFVFYNKVVANVFDVSRDAWVGKKDVDLFPAELANRYRAHDQDVLAANALQVVSEETRNPDGSTSCWKSYKFPCSDADGETLIGGVSVDVTEELRQQAELQRFQAELLDANELLQKLAQHDALTGLANRRMFDDRITLDFAQAKRKKRQLSIMMLDLDHFKQRNDLYGHQNGDETLRQFGAILAESVRTGDLAARYGGEEFVVLLPETDDDDAVILAERILDNIRKAEWEGAPLTVSIGLACVDGAMTGQQRLVQLADEALYAAKRAGRDRVVSYKEYFKRLMEEIAGNPA